MTDIDKNSAQLTVSSAGAKADVFVGTEAALIHCTVGANTAIADNRGHGKPTFGNAFKWTGQVRAQGDHTELVTNWKFSFLEFSDTIVYESIYGGRMPNEGSMRVNYLRGFGTNPCLDALSRNDSFPFLDAIVNIKPIRLPSTPNTFDVICEAGDNPSGLENLIETNMITNAPNHLFSIRRDEGLFIVFVARGPGGRILPLAHFTAHVIWHIEFLWTSPATRPVAVRKNLRMDIGRSVLGPPNDPRLTSLLTNPRGPTANDQDAQANIAAWIQRREPILMQFRNRLQEIPNNFFPSNQP